MQGYLTKLTSFNNRYYKAPSGQEASVWIRDTYRRRRMPFPDRIVYYKGLTCALLFFLGDHSIPYKQGLGLAIRPPFMVAELYRREDPRKC